MVDGSDPKEDLGRTWLVPCPVPLCKRITNLLLFKQGCYLHCLICTSSKRLGEKTAVRGPSGEKRQPAGLRMPTGSQKERRPNQGAPGISTNELRKFWVLFQRGPLASALIYLSLLLLWLILFVYCCSYLFLTAF